MNSYFALRKDFEAIEEGLSHVWHPKMRFIFKDLSRIANTVSISYDSKSIYLWSPKLFKELKKLTCGFKDYYLYKIPHRLKINNEWQYAWCAGIWDKKIETLLPYLIKKSTNFEIPRISGGLLTPFIKLQKKIKGLKNNPYITKESYMATIIHEFAHVYWNSFKMWWPSDKRENLSYLNLARKILSQNSKTLTESLHFPTIEAFGEVFAFCTEYEAAKIFWASHKKKLDTFARSRIDQLITKEKIINLDSQDSVIEPNKYPHDFALIFGKIILTKYPKHWPTILTDQAKLKTIL